MSNCASCYHPKENHKGICNGSLTCLCQNYEPEISEFVGEINRSLQRMRTTIARVKYIHEKIPNLRNAGDKSFPKAYKKLVYNLNQNDPIPRGLWKEMPSDDDMNRAKRRVREKYPHLAKFDHHSIVMAGATQQGILEGLYE